MINQKKTGSMLNVYGASSVFVLPCCRVPASEDAESVDWVWETHVPRQWKEVHDKAKVLNR